MRHAPSAILLFALILSACGSAGPSSRLGLRRVVLYQNGVGYFERRGIVEDDTLALRFSSREVDDVLGTLTVLDTSGRETVVSASVPERLPGEGDIVTLDLRLPDRRTRDLVLTYAVPTPAWRAAYRIVLPEEGRSGDAVFQIWALIHNASPEDWDRVDISLATSAPFSFAVDLRTPEFVARPDVTGRLIAPALSGAVMSERGRGGEDYDGFEDEDGIPDLDNDHDRIPDVDDACPNDPETYNGTDDEDGCPDRGRVVVSETSITILDHIYFAARSSEIREESLPIVDAIAQTLIGNPNLTSVRVSGHASSDEPDTWGLSAERAGAVRAALIARGVQPGRLLAVPFADTQPVDPRPTAEGRERNRRVDMFILETSEGATASVESRHAFVTPEAVHASSAALADVAQAEGTTRYDVSAPVSIPARSSSLVTILSAHVAGGEVLLYRPEAGARGSDSHPFRAARVHCPDSATLIPGPVAVYAGGTFVGEGLIEHVHEGDIATIPYAMDATSVVARDTGSGSEPVRLVAAARGVLRVEDRLVRRTTYTIDPGPHTPPTLVLHHPRQPGTAPRGLPPDTETLPGELVLQIPITSATRSVVTVEETSSTTRSITLLSDLRTPLTPYLDASGLDAPMRARVEAILTQRAELGRVEQEIAGFREQFSDAATRAAELRANLRAATGAELRRTLEARLRDAAAATDHLSDEIARRSAHVTELRASLSEAIGALTIEPSAPASE